MARPAQKSPVCLTVLMLLSALRVMHYSSSRDPPPSPPSCPTRSLRLAGTPPEATTSTRGMA